MTQIKNSFTLNTTHCAQPLKLKKQQQKQKKTKTKGQFLFNSTFYLNVR